MHEPVRRPTGNDGIFVSIPSGWFFMGSDEGQDDEKPVHRVWVDAFDLAAYPVTEAQYARFMEATGHDAPRDWASSGSVPDLPVVGVSWADAQAYCTWRSRAEQVRLPTEAEWERAARGGVEGARYPWGDDIPDWVPNGGRGPRETPWPVTLGVPNAYGVYGIAGNIHEWCYDWHDAGFYRESPARNPAGPARGVRRASRGGSWRHAVTMSRSAARSRLHPAFRYTDYGFRVVRGPSRHEGGGNRGPDEAQLPPV
jgi:formylglycine-generating enzyme required for sulfatase activity